MIWNPEVECADAVTLKRLQTHRFKILLSHLAQKNAVYQKKFQDAKINVSDITDISEIQKFPFTVKEDLRDTYPFGLFTNFESTMELHVSSGTTGNPIVVGYTKKDLKLWANVMARSFALAGAEPKDMIQIAYGYGLFTGGLGAHYGALEFGLKILPMSVGQSKRQLKLMQDFKPRILACTPSYALYLLDEAHKQGLDPQKSSWEIGVFGAEPWSESMRVKIENAWGLQALDIYGLSEIIGPGVAHECHCKCGLHVQADVFYPEVIDPITHEPKKDGEEGELVFTTLTKQALPLLRYRTRDIVTIDHQPCACGRTTPRISKILGRTDDMLIIRGINVFPSQIEYVLLKIEGITPHYQLIVDRQNNLDTLEILVEVDEAIFSDEIKKLQSFAKKVKKEIEYVLGIDVSVRLVEPKTIERSEGKAKRIIDRRQI